MHLRVEQRALRPAMGLGLVHGHAGVAQHILGPVERQGAGGDPDAGTAVKNRALHAERRLQRSQQLLGLARRRLRRGRADHQHREGVATDPRQRVAGAKGLAQSPGHQLQEGVAGGMAQAVVDQTEPVDVQADHREPVLVGR